MRRRTALILVAGAVVPLAFGALVVARSTTEAAPGEATAPAAATAAVERRTLNATTQVDGTLGYGDASTVANTLATSGGGDTSGAQQALASAQGQYDAAAAALEALRHPTATDIAQLRTQVAQAAASVTQAGASLAYDKAVLKSAKTDLATCQAGRSAAAPAASPDPSAAPSPTPPSCDVGALRLAVKQAERAVKTDAAQLTRASRAQRRADRAGCGLRHPTAAKEEYLLGVRLQMCELRRINLPEGG